MEYKIVMDSAGDIHSLPGTVPFACVPLTISAGSEHFVDDAELDAVSMAKAMRSFKGKSGTACPSIGAYLDAFGDAQHVFCITITSGLSGSYNAAKIAAESYLEQYPDRTVYVVDSLSAGPEMTVLAEKIRDLIEAGLAYEEILQGLEDYQKHVQLVFSLESVMNLANNGRLNGTIAKIVGLLGIRMVGRASDVGTLELIDKSRGEKKAITDLIKNMVKLNYQGGRVLIHHCDNLAAAENFKSQLLAKFPGAAVTIGALGGLCAFYAEYGGMLAAFETA